MGYVVKLVDCVANAFIHKMKNGDTLCFSPFSELEEYGRKVVDELEMNGFEAYTCFSRDKTEEMFCSEEDCFSPAILHGENGVRLNVGFTRSDLIRRFRGYLPLDMLLAYCKVGHDMFEEKEKK